MKALVLEVAGRKAVLLLPGGEMRTVRAQKAWRTGMEVSVKPYPLSKKKKGRSLRAAFYPLAACAAAFLIVFAGFRLLTGVHIDRQYPIGPLASGQPTETFVPAETPAATDAPTQEPTAIPTLEPTPVPTDAPTAELTPNPTPAASPVPPLPTPAQQTGRSEQHSGQRCDECGEYGHDDDDCPNERCDECGGYGHDDDDCPNERCDECGEYGHDDDDCPNRHGGKHHDD